MARHIVITIMMDKTVIKIVARVRDIAVSNLGGATACAFASWTRTNMTARHSMQYAAVLNVAMLPSNVKHAKWYRLYGDLQQKDHNANAQRQMLPQTTNQG